MKTCWSVVSMIYIVKPQPNNISFGGLGAKSPSKEQLLSVEPNLTQKLKLIGLGSNTYNYLFYPVLHPRCEILQ